MRMASLGLIVLTLALVDDGPRPAQAAPPDGAGLAGKWKLVILAYGNDEFLVLEAKPGDGKLSAQVKDSQPFLPQAQVKSFEAKGDSLTTVVQTAQGEITFSGTLVKEGPQSGQVLGTIRFRGDAYPARLEKTEADKVAALTAGPVRGQVALASREADPKVRAEKLKALAAEHAGSPTNYQIYLPLLQVAAELGQPEQDVHGYLEKALATAKPYGESWTNEVRSSAIQVLSKKKPYAGLALELATAADQSLSKDAPIEDKAKAAKQLSDAAKAAGKEDLAREADGRAKALALDIAVAADKSVGASGPDAARAKAAKQLADAAKAAGKDDLAREADGRAKALALDVAIATDKAVGAGGPAENRARAARQLADAAKAAGKEDLAREAEERASKLERKLDEEYLATVPPFKPDSFGGRKEKKNDRVVLLELFTGAQCPPCVAADVAFDALNETYKPTELIALQYHLHIPGPDPLTNSDSVERSGYYQVGGTPSALFNGQPDSTGGGFMQHAKSKYDHYRQLVDEGLEAKKKAAIELDVKRSGDQIRIKASAQTQLDPDAKDAKAKGSNLRLRLALVEDSVRYTGGNKLRFHHHIVRALPGGVEGKSLADGRGEAEVNVNLADVRKQLDAYLSESEKARPFPNPLPPIELKDLSVVAFVQDDGDKSVWQAVLAPVEEAK